MSEGWEASVRGDAAASEPAAPGLTAGAMLRQSREAAGLHIGALAVALKVPVRKLEALEADRYDLLNDAVFMRALAASICRTFKVDPGPVLERLPAMAAPRLTGHGRSINEPFRAPGDGAPPTWLDQLSRPVFLAVFALLLGALVLVLLPKAQQADATAPTANSVATLQPSAPPVQPSMSVPAVPEAATAVISPALAAAVTAPAASSAVAPAAGAAKPAASSPVSAMAAEPLPAKAVADAPAAPASGVIVFRAKGPSWVEVIDAKDVVAVRKVLEAGETAAASGALPLRVTIGRIDATQVQVRGKPFDLRRVSRDNVARFEVK